MKFEWSKYCKSLNLNGLLFIYEKLCAINSKLKTQNSKLISYLLILLLLVQTFAKISFMAYYELNKKEITMLLCENKNKPELNCLGKCYVEKSLKKIEKGLEQKKKSIEKLTQFPFIQHITQIKVNPIFKNLSISHFTFYNSPFTSSPPIDFFHPPCCEYRVQSTRYKVFKFSLNRYFQSTKFSLPCS